MRANQLALLVSFLVLGVAAAQQTNSASSVTNSGTIAELKARAEKGDVAAEFQLGWTYNNGDGVSKDGPEAFKWWLEAAENGDARAPMMIATICENGSPFYGVSTNIAEATLWYRKGAEEGDIHAQNLLGWMYLVGHGVTQDHAESVRWYRKAAEQGDSNAQEGVGHAYQIGDGVAQNYTEAAKWFRRAAEQGYLVAQDELAQCCENGTGVPKNNVEAYKWYNLVAAHSASGENEALNELERNLIENAAHLRDLMVESGEITPEEIAEAQQLSVAFVPRKETTGSNSNLGSPVASDAPIASGTGFFITDDGYLISNYHVVKDATKVRLLTSAGLIDAKVVQVDAANDLALLKADGRFAPLPIAASRRVNLGSTVATIGFPDIGLQGFAPKLAKGEIASLSGASDDPRYFQISVPVQPGNSGGALVDERGNVIGIVSAKLDASAALAASGQLPENVNYAVKSSFLLGFLESVPDVDAKLKAPNTKDEKFEDVVKSAQDAAVLVLVY